MRDPSDPPPQVYGFKPKSFERLNTPPSEPPPAVCPPPSVISPPPAPSSDQPIRVQDLHQAAAIPGPVLRPPSSAVSSPSSAVSPLSPVSNDVQALLRDNLARETAAGLHPPPAPVRRKPRRRLRDYLIVLLVGDGLLAISAIVGFRTSNAIQFVSAMAGLGLFTFALTWVMWFVMDDY